jgi:GT2 family glycosyltransferase
MNLAIVIINIDRHADMIACLRSLARSEAADHSRVYSCNLDVSPAHVQQLQRLYPDIEQIELDQNYGYAGNNNIGIERAMADGADWILLLNDDTEFAPDCFSAMMRVAMDDPTIGIVGPMVYHFDEPNIIQSAGADLGPLWRSEHAGQNEVDRGQFSSPRDVDWVSGCALLVHRDVVQRVGPLDERFFMYWEETEWCLRAKRGGFRVVHAPEARLWHKGVRRDYRPAPYVTYYMTRNRFLFLQKQRAPGAAWRDAWFTTLRTLAAFTLKEEWREIKAEERTMMRRALRDYWVNRWGPMPDF